MIKVFLDSPTSETTDARLEQAMRGGRVILQATINPEPPASSALHDRFAYKGPASGVRAQISGPAGWLPIERFQNAAVKVCFTDAQVITTAPLVEELAGKLYRSLFTCVLEEAVGGELSSLGPSTASIGVWRVPVGAGAGVAVKIGDTTFPDRMPAQDVMLATSPIRVIEGKIAILTYTGSKSPTFPIDGKPVKAHQAFLAVLRSLFPALQPVPPIGSAGFPKESVR